MPDTQVVTVKLTATELKIVDELIFWSHARSRSDVIREALMVLARVWKVKGEARRQVRLERMKVNPRRSKRVMQSGRENKAPCGPLEPARPY